MERCWLNHNKTIMHLTRISAQMFHWQQCTIYTILRLFTHRKWRFIPVVYQWWREFHLYSASPFQVPFPFMACGILALWGRIMLSRPTCILTLCSFPCPSVQPLRSSLKKSESQQQASPLSDSGADGGGGHSVGDRRAAFHRQTSLSQSIRK